MKKHILILFFILPIISFPNFLDDLTNIDEYIKQNQYEKAYNIVKNIDITGLTNDDILILESIKHSIEEKLPKEEVKIDKVEETKDNKNEPLAPVINQKDRSFFKNIEKYELQVLEEKDPEKINELARIYIKNGLIEKAARLALLDDTRDIKNIFIAATAKRLMADYDKAISLYNEVLNKDDSVYNAYLGLGISYKQKGDFYRAIRNLKKYATYDNSPEILKEIEIIKTLE